jgi:hypothetical protein
MIFCVTFGGNIIIKFFNKKRIITLLVIINMLFTTGMSFAYWASSVAAPNGVDDDSDITLGEWYDAIPIFTVSEFVDMIIINNNTQDYVLARNLDFEGITPAEWISDDTRVFSGSFDGNGKSLNNINLTDFRGIFSVLEGASIKDLTLNNVNINYTVANTTTSGILAGRLQGTGNIIDGIQINDSGVSNSSVLAGGLFGFASPLAPATSGDAIITNIDISNSTISGGYVSATYGNGGLIGSVNNFSITLENLNLDVDVSSPNALNSGGVIGATLGTSVLDMTNVNVAGSNISITGTGAALGSGGIVGYLVGTGHTFNNVSVSGSSITSNSLSGGLIGYANQASATLSIEGAFVTSSTISSTQASTTLGNGGMIGSVNGYTVSITDGLVTSTVTSSGAASVGGVVGTTTNTGVLNLTNIDVTESIISIGGTGTALGAGGFVGLLLGTGHTFNNIDLIDSSVTSSSATGGLIGYANEASATLTINGTSVTGSAISSGIATLTLGNGGMIGTVNGFTVNISNGLVSSNVTSTSTSNAGGILGANNDASVLNLSNVLVENSTIQINGTNAALGAGGAIGYLTGTGHSLVNIDTNSTTVTSNSSSGGLIGYATRASLGTITIDGTNITQGTVSSSLNSTTLGNGGVIGTLLTYTLNLLNTTVETSVTSTTTTNAGGILGVNNNTSILNLTNVLVENSTIQINGSNTGLGAGGAIGYLTGTGHSLVNVDTNSTTVTSNSSSGGLIGYVTRASLGTITIDGTNITQGNVSSALNSATLGNGGVIGTLLTYTLNLLNTTVETSVTSTTTTNAGGIVGYNNATAKLNYTDVSVNNSTISITGSNTNLGAGGTNGLTLGFGHSFLRVRIIDTNVTAANSVGGLIGRFNGASGVSNFNNIKAKGINVNTTVNSNTISAGGMVGFIQGSSTDLRFFDVYVEGIIQSNAANVGGIIGYTASNTITRVSRAVVYADILVNNPASLTSRGAGGIFGRHAGTTFQITDAFFTGRLKARVISTNTQAGIIRHNTATPNPTVTNVRSAEVSFHTTGTTYFQIQNSTDYARLLGQSPGFATHVVTRNNTSLNEITYWQANFGSFSGLLWEYNISTFIYELRD